MMKRLVIDPEDPTKSLLKGTASRFSGKIALQMAQILSYNTAYDTLFAIRKGAVAREFFSQSLRDLEKKNRSSHQAVGEFDLSLLWRDIQQRNPTLDLGGCRLDIWWISWNGWSQLTPCYKLSG